MVQVITKCYCHSCPGTQAPTNQKPGELVFGGTICNCRCHQLKGKERDEFIELMGFLYDE